MNKWIARIVAVLLFGGGLYGIIASLWFTKTQIFSCSMTKAEVKQYYDREIQPGIDERMAKLNLSALPAAERTNFQQVITWIATDHDFARSLALRGHIVLFSITISLFSIVIGIIILVWTRQNDLRKLIDKQTQLAMPSYSEPATRSNQE